MHELPFLYLLLFIPHFGYNNRADYVESVAAYPYVAVVPVGGVGPVRERDPSLQSIPTHTSKQPETKAYLTPSDFATLSSMT